MNANEFFLNRAGTAKPEFRRNDASGALGGPIRQGRTFFFVRRAAARASRPAMPPTPPRRPACRSASATCGRPRRIAGVANEWLRNGAADNPAFAANFLRALRAFPAEQQAGPHRQVLHRRRTR